MTNRPKLDRALLATLLCCSSLTLVRPAAAQQRAGLDPAAQLARAITLEEAEHDPAAALPVYRALSADRAASAEVRTRAALRAALAARALGQAEVAEAALQQAARGRGDAAERAKQLLQDPSRQVADDIDVRVLQLVARLREGDDLGFLNEIVFYGERAVPIVVRVADRESSDMRYVQLLARCVWRIGGDRALQWLRAVRESPDALKRRAVVMGARLHNDPPAADVAAELAEFLGDSDPAVRVEALTWRTGLPLPPDERVFDLLLDDDSRVRDAALRYLTRRPGISAVGESESREARVCSLIAARPQLDGAVVERLLDALPSHNGALPGVVSDPAARRAMAALCGVEWSGGLDSLRVGEVASNTVTGPDECVDELLAAARVHGAWDGSGNRGIKPTIAQLVRGVSFSWTPKSRDAALELLGLGYSVSPTYWEAHADEIAWRKILTSVEIEGGSSHRLVERAVRAARDFELSAAEVDRLRGLFEAGLARQLMINRREDVLRLLHEIGRTLSAQPGDEAGRWARDQLLAMGDRGISELSREGGAWDATRWMIFAGMTRQTDVGRQRIVREMALDPRLDEAAIRNQAVGWLLHHGVAEPFTLLRDAHSLPLHGLATGQDYGVRSREMPEMVASAVRIPHPIGVQWLLVEQFHPYDREQVRALLLQLLDTGTQESWSAVYSIWSNQVRPGEPWLRDAMLLRWQSCPTLNLLAQVISARKAGAVRGTNSPYSWEQRPPSREVSEAALDCLRARAVASTDFDERRRRQRNFFELLSECYVRDATISRSPVVTRSLEEMAGWGAGPLGEEVAWTRLDAIDQLLGYQPDRVDELIEHYGLKNDRFRRVIYSFRLAQPDADRQSLVLEGLADSYSSIRHRACIVAAELRSRELVEPLIEALRDESDSVREEAQKALEATRFYLEQQSIFRRLLGDGAIGQPASAAEALVRQARDESNSMKVRIAAIASLGTLGVPESLPILIEFMKSDSADLSAAAERAVARINAGNEPGSGEPAKNDQAPADKK